MLMFLLVTRFYLSKTSTLPPP